MKRKKFKKDKRPGYKRLKWEFENERLAQTQKKTGKFIKKWSST